MTLLNRRLRPDRTALGRDRELETGRLVERAAAARIAGAGHAAFLVRRASSSVAGLDAGQVRQALGRAVSALEELEPDRRALSGAFVCYGGTLERHGLRGAAVSAYEAALAVDPDDGDVMLHAARSHRKAGNREAALALYRRARERGDARVARFSALGEALLTDTPEQALGAVLAEAESAGDAEVTAVTLEERARLRRMSGRASEAIDDLMAAALAYDDRRDRLRVAHLIADLLLARGDLDAAREALLAAVDLAQPEDGDHAGLRLRALARAQGDVVGVRRWRRTGRSSLVSLMPSAGRAPVIDSSWVSIRRWRDALASN